MSEDIARVEAFLGLMRKHRVSTLVVGDIRLALHDTAFIDVAPHQPTSPGVSEPIDEAESIKQRLFAHVGMMPDDGQEGQG